MSEQILSYHRLRPSKRESAIGEKNNSSKPHREPTTGKRQSGGFVLTLRRIVIETDHKERAFDSLHRFAVDVRAEQLFVSVCPCLLCVYD